MDIRLSRISYVPSVKKVERSIDQQKQKNKNKEQKSFEDMLKDAKDQKKRDNRDDK